jgi:hypothetical protein
MIESVCQIFIHWTSILHFTAINSLKWLMGCQQIAPDAVCPIAKGVLGSTLINHCEAEWEFGADLLIRDEQTHIRRPREKVVLRMDFKAIGRDIEGMPQKTFFCIISNWSWRRLLMVFIYSLSISVVWYDLENRGLICWRCRQTERTDKKAPTG